MTGSTMLSGGGGTALHVAMTGPEGAPPLLFVHGYLQSHLCWQRQFAGPLAGRFRLHALDLRGHGMSERPGGHAPYQDNTLWAADLCAAVAACGAPPVVVVWSYAGLILGDYLRHHGDCGLAGIVLVAALVGLGQTRPAPGPDSALPLHSTDIARALPALRAFNQRLTSAPLSAAELAEFTAASALVPAHARLGAMMRTENYLPDLARVTCPAAVVYGTADALVGRQEADDALSALPHARLLLYDGIGHMPFYEASGQFDADLADFAGAAFGGRQ